MTAALVRQRALPTALVGQRAMPAAWVRQRTSPGGAEGRASSSGEAEGHASSPVEEKYFNSPSEAEGRSKSPVEAESHVNSPGLWCSVMTNTSELSQQSEPSSSSSGGGAHVMEAAETASAHPADSGEATSCAANMLFLGCNLPGVLMSSQLYGFIMLDHQGKLSLAISLHFDLKPAFAVGKVLTALVNACEAIVFHDHCFYTIALSGILVEYRLHDSVNGLVSHFTAQSCL